MSDVHKLNPNIIGLLLLLVILIHSYKIILQTLERSYLLRLDGKIAERPQHMLMRVAVGIHHENIEAAIEVL